MASVALANGVNANLVRRWVLDSDAVADRVAPQLADSTKRALSTPPNFVPLQLPTPSPTDLPTMAADIRIEVKRGATAITLTWPVVAASECAAWMRELLR